MNSNEFYVHTSSHALGLTSFAGDVCNLTNDDNTGKEDNYDEDNYEEILDELSDMSLDKFKTKYPTVYKTYFVDKLIDTTHIVIYYYFPLFAEISKIYVSQDGFTISDIATLIKKQYKKFYINRKNAIKNNVIPKYISPNSYDLNSLCLRFHINYQPLNLSTSIPTLLCNHKFPIVVVRCDT